ncbi:hypothetical protein SAMN05660657_02846 [Geodermatophilus amargosae]|uniref:Uncharacterized protein n=1 Tax=Geodermatophilus amargosae TaxID=1296565 RepID=A0A1I7AKE8_9ACTN|nr:hypothetical protein [Geodermatophilus amargosae]SFT75315.1 hypothetical protein SAMN05660657_02846 [Geodermatophilus amargosae]
MAGTRGEDSVRVTLDEGVSLTVSIGCVDHTREQDAAQGRPTAATMAGWPPASVSS